MILLPVVAIALVIHVLLIGICLWRVWRGENGIDRLLNADVIGTLMLGIFVLLALFENALLYLDAALGLAVLAMIGTIALARFIANKRVF
jgi:multisubunit Na+/H+ antiporter MnhF subunit